MSKIVLEDFNEGNGYYKVNLAYLSKEQVEEIENIVSKWNPTNEDIKNCIGMCLTDANEQRFKDYGTNLKDCLAWLKKQDKEEYALKSFKDEDVRKFMQYIEKEAKAYEFNLPNRGYDIYAFAKDILIWLEKQGEQKPIDKAESEFKIGAWITFYGGKPFKILKVESELNGVLDYLLLDQNGHDSYYNKKYVDENARLWKIKDAKPGDVLVHNDCTFIFMGIKDGIVQAIEENILEPVSFGKPDEDNDYHPVTKEQHDLLFQKMRKKGYMWDAENGKLKKIEKQGESIKIKKGKNYLCTKTHKYAGVEWIEGVKYYSPEDYSLVNQGCTYYCPKYSKEEHNNFFKEVEYDGCLEKQWEKFDYNPYKEAVKSISIMVEKYAKPNSDLQNFYDNVKVKCKDAMEYEKTWLEKQGEQKPKFKI